jgi:hypothetical protein
MSVRYEARNPSRRFLAVPVRVALVVAFAIVGYLHVSTITTGYASVSPAARTATYTDVGVANMSAETLVATPIPQNPASPRTSSPGPILAGLSRSLLPQRARSHAPHGAPFMRRGPQRPQGWRLARPGHRGV